MTSRSRLALVAAVIFVGILAVAFMKRCGTEDKPVQPNPAAKPKPEAAGNLVPETPGPVEASPPREVPSKPADQKRRLVVTDIFGMAVKGAEISVTRSDGLGGRKIITDEDGHGRIPIDLGDDSYLHCGDWHVPLRLIERGGAFEIPGISKPVFGELAILPSGWDELRVTPEGQKSWHRANVSDERLGHRFLFLHAGTYEIGNLQGRVFDKTVVIAGQRTNHVITQAGIRLSASFEVEPDPLPSMVRIQIKGVSAGTTYPKGWNIILMVRNGQREYAELGLVPGLYEVSAVEPPDEFIEHVTLAPGSVQTVKVRLKRR